MIPHPDALQPGATWFKMVTDLHLLPGADQPMPHEEMLFTPEHTLELIDDMVERLCRECDRFRNEIVVVGIRKGGAVVARRLRERLTQRLDWEVPLGFLDITFYRDDLDTVGPNPVLAATELDFDIDGKRILLVDDVLYTGRTIRAALNALFDYGRPAIVNLIVLIDRGHRQLPIQPDLVGAVVETGNREYIRLLQDKEVRYTVVHRFLDSG